MNANWAAQVMAQANARTETEYEKADIDGYAVESVKRGVNHTDWMAWVNGNRGIWGAGRTRQEAIDSAIRTAKSMNEKD